MSEVTNNFYISGNYIAEQHIENQTINYTGDGVEHVSTMYPSAGDYKAVVQWLEKKKQKGEDLYAGSNYNRTKMCTMLSKIFGWEVNPNSLLKHEQLQKK